MRTCLYPCTESLKLRRPQFIQILFQHCHTVMSISGHGTYARKMLQAGTDPPFLNSGNHCRRHIPRQNRVAPKGTFSDGRIGGIGYNIRHRGKVQIQPQFIEIESYRGAGIVCFHGISARTDIRHIAHFRHFNVLSHSPDRAALFVHGQKQRVFRPHAHRIGKHLYELLLVHYILIEIDKTAHRIFIQCLLRGLAGLYHLTHSRNGFRSHDK